MFNDYDDSIVIGGGTELLPDGRKLKYEAWGECGYTFLTYTLSSAGLEKYSKEQIVNYLISQGIKINTNQYPLKVMELVSDTDRYRLTITCGESDE